MRHCIGHSNFPIPTGLYASSPQRTERQWAVRPQMDMGDMAAAAHSFEGMVVYDHWRKMSAEFWALMSRKKWSASYPQPILSYWLRGE